MGRKKHITLKRCLLWTMVAMASMTTVLPVEAQSGLYVPTTKPVKDMQKALRHAERFVLLLKYDDGESAYRVEDLDLLDSAYRLAFDIENLRYYTMSIEGFGTSDEKMTKERVDGVYRYFAMRGAGGVPVRYARNRIHCSCHGDTTETLRFEVPTTTAVYDVAQLPEARRTLNKSIDLKNCVLVSFEDDPDECVGAARGCYVPQEDSVVHGYYASLLMVRGSVYAVDGTKDTCPGGLEVEIEDHLDYKTIVDKYNMVPHRKHIIVQAGYVVLKTNWAYGNDSCEMAQKDSIFVRVPATKEQVEAKLKFFAKTETARGVEYKQLPTRKTPGKAELTLQAPINITQFDTIYLGKRIQENELKKYFYEVDGPTEAAAFKVEGKYYVAYKVGKKGEMELKKPLKALFRIVPEQEEEVQKEEKSAIRDAEEMIED